MTASHPSTNDQTPSGTFACPICGHDRPHAHTEAEKHGYWEDQVRADGWTSTDKQRPKERGWYLCLGVEFPKEACGFRRDQLSWFKWVRDAMCRGQRDAEIPEVLYFDQFDGWSLRNALGDAHYDGSEGRHRVVVYPRYWREIPALSKVPK